MSDDDDDDDDELELIRCEMSVGEAARWEADPGWSKEIIIITGSRHILSQPSTGTAATSPSTDLQPSAPVSAGVLLLEKKLHVKLTKEMKGKPIKLYMIYYMRKIIYDVDNFPVVSCI